MPKNNFSGGLFFFFLYFVKLKYNRISQEIRLKTVKRSA